MHAQQSSIIVRIKGKNENEPHFVPLSESNMDRFVVQDDFAWGDISKWFSDKFEGQNIESATMEFKGLMGKPFQWDIQDPNTNYKTSFSSPITITARDFDLPKGPRNVIIRNTKYPEQITIIDPIVWKDLPKHPTIEVLIQIKAKPTTTSTTASIASIIKWLLIVVFTFAAVVSFLRVIMEEEEPPLLGAPIQGPDTPAAAPHEIGEIEERSTLPQIGEIHGELSQIGGIDNDRRMPQIGEIDEVHGIEEGAAPRGISILGPRSRGIGRRSQYLPL